MSATESKLETHDSHTLFDDAKRDAVDCKKALTFIVIGASGDLAKKKTFPALFHLFKLGLLPEDAIFAGYARSDLTPEVYHEKISTNFKDHPAKAEFLKRCHYFRGQYGDKTDWAKVSADIAKLEAEVSTQGSNRIFYLAIPPTLFVDVGRGIQPEAMSQTGWNRVIVEKPFGRDSESSLLLGEQLGALFQETQLYRIDHYLGKEMVQNLMTLRFSNTMFEPIWNRHYIQSVTITFKEPFGTKGRGGYFDNFGIIRDVLQNHLLQVLALTAMEPPVTMNAEDVRDEKVKLLRAIPPIVLEETVIGQYGADPKGSESSYVGDPTVPDDSITPTYAACLLHINNERWNGVPFFLKAGKALNERKAEVRIQFKKPQNSLFPRDDLSNNELVLRLQPDEAVYMKMTTKNPGLEGGVAHTEMDLSYHQRFSSIDQMLELPDAYETLIFECVRGDHNLFVRSDELVAAWSIFTPLLHQLEREKVQPIVYEYGSRGPKESDELLKKFGFERTHGYSWKGHTGRL